jgi:hypothetical protein
MTLSSDRTLPIMPPADQTAQRLKQIPLSLPAGPLRQIWNAEQNQIIIFADPGSEPTEHLLTEMLELAPEFRALRCRIALLTDTRAAMEHPTVGLLREKLPAMDLHYLQDEDMYK